MVISNQRGSISTYKKRIENDPDPDKMIQIKKEFGMIQILLHFGPFNIYGHIQPKRKHINI
jgi:hypothetical protein